MKQYTVGKGAACRLDVCIVLGQFVHVDSTKQGTVVACKQLVFRQACWHKPKLTRPDPTAHKSRNGWELYMGSAIPFTVMAVHFDYD